MNKIAVSKNRFGSTYALYGIPVLFTATALSIFTGGLNVSTYIALSLAPAAGIFLVRSFLYGFDTTFEQCEVSALALSAIGLSPIVASLGLLVFAVSRTDYNGVDKWIPNVKDAETELQRYIYKLELSEETHRYSLEILEELRTKELFNGRGIEEMISGIIYIAAREQNEPRSLDEIASISGASKKGIGKAYRSIGRDLEIGIRPPDPENFLERFGDKLDLSESSVEEARKIVRGAKEKDLTSGKSPTSIAASAIYLAAHKGGEHRTMNEISDILNVTTITIRNRSRELVSELELENYPENLEKGLQ